MLASFHFELFAAVGFPVAAETGVQHDKVNTPAVERVVRLLLVDPFEELFLRERIDAVIAEDVMAGLRDRRELFVHRLEVGPLGRHRVGGVD